MDFKRFKHASKSLGILFNKALNPLVSREIRTHKEPKTGDLDEELVARPTDAEELEVAPEEVLEEEATVAVVVGPVISWSLPAVAADEAGVLDGVRRAPNNVVVVVLLVAATSILRLFL